jgi:hypothetical protein
MITLNLNGPEGNVFALMGTAKNLAKQLDMNATEIINEMRAGDYNHALDVFEKHFGSVVEFINDPREESVVEDY